MTTRFVHCSVLTLHKNLNNDMDETHFVVSMKSGQKLALCDENNVKYAYICVMKWRNDHNGRHH
jgi:hypothetical protein